MKKTEAKYFEDSCLCQKVPCIVTNSKEMANMTPELLAVRFGMATIGLVRVKMFDVSPPSSLLVHIFVWFHVIILNVSGFGCKLQWEFCCQLVERTVSLIE